MTRPHKTLEKILAGRSDSSVAFRDLRHLLLTLGFEERVQGGHYIYTREGMVEIINLQPRGTLAKPYQVKQVRRLILEHGLGDVL